MEFATWTPRPVPADLEARYVAEGFWTDDTLGAVAADGLARLADTGFFVHSDVRPWQGTFGDVDRMARSLAGWLVAQGIGPGDVVLLQLPNWVEAAASFFAAAYVGAVVVPVVHFYGPKEVGYILRVTRPKVVITADRFGHTDHLANYAELLAPARSSPVRNVGSWSATHRPPTSPRVPSRSRRCSTRRRSSTSSRSTPRSRRSSRSPRAPRVTRRAWCTRTARSCARSATSTGCTRRAARRRSPARRSVTSWAW